MGFADKETLDNTTLKYIMDEALEMAEQDFIEPLEGTRPELHDIAPVENLFHSAISMALLNLSLEQMRIETADASLHDFAPAKNVAEIQKRLRGLAHEEFGANLARWIHSLDPASVPSAQAEETQLIVGDAFDRFSETLIAKLPALAREAQQRSV